jgi:hypothetical protein
MGEDFINKLKYLSGVDYIKEDVEDIGEDPINADIYNGLNEAEKEGTVTKLGSKYIGEVLIYISPELFRKPLEEIKESIRFDKDLYKNNIMKNVDFSGVIYGNNLKVIDINVENKDNNEIIIVKYKSDIE